MVAGTPGLVNPAENYGTVVSLGDSRVVQR